MNSMNEMAKALNNVKDKAAAIISDVLILQAEQGIKHSWIPNVSEPDFAVDLMKEDAS